AGTMTIFKTKVSSATSNVIGVKQVRFDLQRTTSNATIAESTYKLFEDGIDVTSLGSFATASADTSVAGADTAQIEFTFTSERAIDSGGKVYEFKGDVAGTIGGAFVTKIANNNTSQNTSDDYTAVAATDSTFTWTDRSASGHAEATEDWMDDYLVKTINASQTITEPTT
ncbi:MAG: hypothetical protein WD898_02915, partial [Candidatus Paceibacterota bacterium]